ncbi:ATP-binding cassette domain-containing protein [Pseudorhodoferax sp. LjRoot39]|uniref:ABC transporter ATP-binding protein n=1 Tax=Pseudorhodoferax sp. LjRoot39 TaxID=3342328 RepID=UPI003ECF6DD3
MPPETLATPLLEVQGLQKHFKVRHSRNPVKAVEHLSFAVPAGSTFAIVGESGCGKTTCAKLILGLEPPSAGSIRFDGRDVASLAGPDKRAWRRQVQAVFQDPYASLNPRLRVATIIAEPILANEKPTRAELDRRIAELLDVVGLPADAARRYPHEFSGGQRQRVAIARALALRPRLLVLDEPTSALDVSIRAQILNLLSDIQQQYGLTYLLIAHDLALVEHFADAVGVMYLGDMVEQGPTAQVFGAPRHPYTRALLASVLRPDPDVPLPVGMIRGEIGSALAPPPGCKFHPRCPQAIDTCRSDKPQPTPFSALHWAACHVEAARATAAPTAAVPAARAGTPLEPALP